MGAVIDFILDANWIIAVSTFLYMLFTGIIIYQTRINLRLQNAPYISSYFQLFKHSFYLELIIENTGSSPAYNLHVFFDEDTIEICKKHKLPLPEKYINYFPVGQKVSHFIGCYDNFKKTDLTHIAIYLKYETKNKYKIKETIKFNYDYLEETELSKPELESGIDTIAKNLQEINETIGNKK